MLRTFRHILLLAKFLFLPVGLGGPLPELAPAQLHHPPGEVRRTAGGALQGSPSGLLHLAGGGGFRGLRLLLLVLLHQEHPPTGGQLAPGQLQGPGFPALWRGVSCLYGVLSFSDVGNKDHLTAKKECVPSWDAFSLLPRRGVHQAVELCVLGDGVEKRHQGAAHAEQACAGRGVGDVGELGVGDV